jgi:hypothetical protein
MPPTSVFSEKFLSAADDIFISDRNKLDPEKKKCLIALN